MPLPFNKALDLKLLKLVKENQALYNPTHAKYLDVDSREVTWQKIGDALNRPAHICKSRWVNIRDMMRRKVRDRLRHPGLHSYHYKYESELAFMTPFYKDSVSTTEDYAEFTEEPEVEAMSESFTEQNFEIEELDVDEIKPNLKQLKTRVSRSSVKEDSSFSEKYQELNPADPIDVFLLTIGSTLRKFNPYFLNQAKSKIFQVVQEYELQQIVNKDDQGKD